MKAIVTSLALLGFLILAVPASAGFLAEKVDEGVFFVSYQRAQFVRGTLIWDTEKKVQRRLEKKVNLFCLEEGYAYYRFPTLGEIARNEELRAAWELVAGDEALNTSDNVGGFLYGGMEHVHKSRRMLLLSESPGEAWEACQSDKIAPAPRTAMTPVELEGSQDVSSLEEDRPLAATVWADDRDSRVPPSTPARP